MSSPVKAVQEHGVPDLLSGQSRTVVSSDPSSVIKPHPPVSPDESTPCTALTEQPILSLAERRSEELQDVTDQLLKESQGILHDALSTFDLDPVQLKKARPPQEWIDELGERRARRRLRVAKAASLPKVKAPVALEHARAVMVGVVAAKAREKGGNKTLNVAFVNVPAPPEYAKVILDMKK